MSSAEDLGRALVGAAPAAPTVSAQVVDVTESGVNLNYQGTLLLDVPCPDSYRGRAAGDWVAVRPGVAPVVLWRLGPDPGGTDTASVQQIAADTAADMIAVSAYTWGTAAPGAGWDQVTTLWTRRDANGVGQLYAQIAGSTPSPTPPTTRPPKTVTISATSSDSWRSGRRDDYASYPMQGDWTGGGNRRGAWFYGTAIADACAGKTVSSMRVALTRRSGSGVNAKRPLHLYLHDYTSPPSGQLELGAGPEELLSLSAGGKGTATLPASWRSALASGSARGLAIYASGRTDYMAVMGGQITITFSV